MTEPVPYSLPSPYNQAAALYFAAGWTGILPLPAQSKKPVPVGYTGHDGVDPKWPDIQSWMDDGMIVGSGVVAAGNIALRLPGHVVGLDIDNYDDKLGLSSYASMLVEWGPLPATWRSSSRSDRHSGIYLFSAPEGLVWPGAPRAGIEIIQKGHRYVVAWPSVHPEGGVYRWHDPNGAVVINQVPQVDELPALPESWIAGLTGGQLRGDVAKAGLTTEATRQWLAEHGAGGPCFRMDAATTRYVNELVDSGLSRHDIAMRATARVARMMTEGHPGGNVALRLIEEAFDQALAKTAHRSSDTGEWARLVEGAVNLAAVGPVESLDPCWDPFAGLIDKERAPSPSASTAPAAATTATGTSPSAPVTTAGVPMTEPTEQLTPQQMLLNQETERQRALRGARKLLDEEEAAKLFRVPIWVKTLTEELALPDDPMVYAVADVLPLDANVLLVAQFKAGKTTLVNSLTRSLVDGVPFLGQFAVSGSEHRVGIFNYEVGRGMYRRWMREADITNTDRVTVLNLRGLRLPLIVPRIEDWVVAWLVEHGITCWIVDPFAGAFVGSGLSENDNGEVGRFLDALDTIKARAGVRELIMPTHTGRVVQEQGSERARGASRLDDWADVRWILTTDKEKNRFFRASGRDVEFDEVKLGYDSITRRVYIDGPGRAKAAAGDLSDRILGAIRAKPGINTGELKKAVGGNASSVTDKIIELVFQQKVRREKAGRQDLHYLVTPSPALTITDSNDSLSIPGTIPNDSSDSRGINSGHPERGRNLNESGTIPSEPDSEPDDDEPTTRLAFTRTQFEDRQEAYRVALMAGGRPEELPDGSLIDPATGEVLWSP